MLAQAKARKGWVCRRSDIGYVPHSRLALKLGMGGGAEVVDPPAIAIDRPNNPPSESAPGENQGLGREHHTSERLREGVSGFTT